jgi:hypothetical protein
MGLFGFLFLSLFLWLARGAFVGTAEKASAVPIEPVRQHSNDSTNGAATNRDRISREDRQRIISNDFVGIGFLSRRIFSLLLDLSTIRSKVPFLIVMIFSLYCWTCGREGAKFLSLL